MRTLGLNLGAFFLLVACATTPSTPVALPTSGLAHLPSGLVTIDPGSADVLFAVSPLGVGRVQGQFQAFDAQLELEDPVAGRARLKASVSTGSAELSNDQYTSMVRSPAWFNSEAFPTAHFDGVLEGWSMDGIGQLKGTMTVRGVSQPETMDFTLSCEGVEGCPQRAVGFVGEMTLSRSAYGMTGLRGLVSDEVDLTVRGRIELR